MHLTPTILEAAYTYLRATPPFNKWKLPEADAVEFRVTNTFYYGEHFPAEQGYGPRIDISRRSCPTTKDLMETMAHEMVHFFQAKGACLTRLAYHGPKFKRLAAQVYKQHGFDPNAF